MVSAGYKYLLFFRYFFLSRYNKERLRVKRSRHELLKDVCFNDDQKTYIFYFLSYFALSERLYAFNILLSTSNIDIESFHESRFVPLHFFVSLAGGARGW